MSYQRKLRVAEMNEEIESRHLRLNRYQTRIVQGANRETCLPTLANGLVDQSAGGTQPAAVITKVERGGGVWAKFVDICGVPDDFKEKEFKLFGQYKGVKVGQAFDLQHRYNTVVSDFKSILFKDRTFYGESGARRIIGWEIPVIKYHKPPGERPRAKAENKVKKRTSKKTTKKAV